MKKYRGLLTLLVLLMLLVSVGWVILRATAVYPTLGEPVVYAVNQLEGFTLSVEKPVWSPFRGYTIQYEIEMASENVYYLETGTGREGPERLERLIDGQWYRLQSQTEHIWNPNTFPLGGDESSGFYGSLVQKHEGYGIRLEAGDYRLIIDLTDTEGDLHYLSAAFTV